MQLLHSLVLARLQSLYDGIRRVRDTSDLSVRFPCAGDDEVARLAQAANHMLEALEQSESARKMDERERDMLKSQLQQAQNLTVSNPASRMRPRSRAQSARGGFGGR